MKEIRLGEVVSIAGLLYVVCGFAADDNGVISAFRIKPFIGDPNRVEDINAALAWTRG